MLSPFLLFGSGSKSSSSSSRDNKNKRPEDNYPEAVTMQDLKTVIIHLSGKASKKEDEIELLTLELARVQDELDLAKKMALGHQSHIDAKDKEIRGLRAELISSLLTLQKLKIADDESHHHSTNNNNSNDSLKDKGNSGSALSSGINKNNNNNAEGCDYKYQYFGTFDQLFQKFQTEVFANRDLRQNIAALRSELDEKDREIVDLKNAPK